MIILIRNNKKIITLILRELIIGMTLYPRKTRIPVSKIVQQYQYSERVSKYACSKIVEQLALNDQKDTISTSAIKKE